MRPEGLEPPTDRVEVGMYQAGGYRPAMWPTVLLEQTPDMSWRPDTLAGLSFDARKLLAYPKLVRRRFAVTRAMLATRTLLPDDRLDQALNELAAVGLSATPTWADRLSVLTAALTAADLKAAHLVFVLAGRGSKSKLVTGLSGVNETEVRSWLGQHHPEVLALEYTIGVGGGKSVDWLSSYAALAGHWLQFCLLTSAKPSNPAYEGVTCWDILKADDCPYCQAAPASVQVSDSHRLPLRLRRAR